MATIGHASPVAALRYQHATEERGPGARRLHGQRHRLGGVDRWQGRSFQPTRLEALRLFFDS